MYQTLHLSNKYGYFVVSLTVYLLNYLDNMARGVTSKDCFSMAKVIPRASFSMTALVAYKVQKITKA